MDEMKERERERNREGSIGFIVVTSHRFTLKSWILYHQKHQVIGFVAYIGLRILHEA